MSGAWYDRHNPGWGLVLLASAAANALPTGLLYAHDFNGQQCWFQVLPALNRDGYDLVKPRADGFPIFGESHVGPIRGKAYVTGDGASIVFTCRIDRNALGLPLDFEVPTQVEISVAMVPQLRVAA
jgi:hypothetical protein